MLYRKNYGDMTLESTYIDYEECDRLIKKVLCGDNGVERTATSITERIMMDNDVRKEQMKIHKQKELVLCEDPLVVISREAVLKTTLMVLKSRLGYRGVTDSNGKVVESKTNDLGLFMARVISSVKGLSGIPKTHRTFW